MNASKKDLSKKDMELGVAWWNTLTEIERRDWLELAGDRVGKDCATPYLAYLEFRRERPNDFVQTTLEF